MPRQSDPTDKTDYAANGVRHGVIVPISALAPHPENYNFHPEEQLDDLRLSLIRYGQVRSIVVQEGAPGHFLIVAGHGLTEAATSLGFIELSADLIPANWSREQVEGYMTSDNELARLGHVNEVKLAELLQRQQDAGYDLRTLGTTEVDFSQMMQRLAAEHLRDAAGNDANDADNGGDEDASGLPDFKEYDESVADDLPTELCKQCGKLCLKPGAKSGGMKRGQRIRR